MNNSRESATARFDRSKIRLRPLNDGDYRLLRANEMSAALTFRWRFHGEHLAPERYSAQLWDGVLCQFVVERVSDSAVLGHVALYNADHVNGHCYLAGAKFSSAEGIEFIVGLLLLVEHAFQGWPMRKIYLEAPEYNYSQFDGAEGWLMDVEGRLSEHTFLDGRYWDLVIGSISRVRWERVRSRVLRMSGAEND